MPVAELKVSPAGSVSVTVTVLSSRSMPAALDTVMVYWPVLPATKLPLCVVVTERSTAGSEVALTICAMSSTRSAPAEYSVVPLVCAGREEGADVVLIDVDAVAGHDALRVDGAVELLHRGHAAGRDEAVVEQVAVVAQRLVDAVHGRSSCPGRRPA